jgi:uncharacterized RDD family membrane protein YckC
MPFLKVNTSQNVLLEFTPGSIGYRILAALIDLLVCAFYIWMASNVLRSFFAIDLVDDNPEILLVTMIILPVILYQPVSEYLWNGRTVGKYLLKLRVISIDGSSPSLGDYLLRWLVRIIDVKLGFLFVFFIPRAPASSTQEVLIALIIAFLVIPFPLVGILSMIFSSTHQRIGDRIAGTVVIRYARYFSLNDTILRMNNVDYVPRLLNVLKLNDGDINIIKNVMEEFKKTGDDFHVRELSRKAASILNITEPMQPVEMLVTILKDYNYMAMQKEKMAFT